MFIALTLNFEHIMLNNINFVLILFYSLSLLWGATTVTLNRTHSLFPNTNTLSVYNVHTHNLICEHSASLAEPVLPHWPSNRAKKECNIILKKLKILKILHLYRIYISVIDFDLNKWKASSERNIILDHFFCFSYQPPQWWQPLWDPRWGSIPGSKTCISCS